MKKSIFGDITFRDIILNTVGSFILAFGIYNIHSAADITEGGVIGLTLLIQHCLGISPAVSNFILTCICYYIGWRTLGRKFIVCSVFAVCSYSAFYALSGFSPRVFQSVCSEPILAAIVGAAFVGLGVGLCVRGGGAPTGDDALAMSLAIKFKTDIRIIYLITDIIVLVFSLSYIKFSEILYSLLTCLLSGQIIGLINRKKK